MKILVLNCGSASVKYKLFEDGHALRGGLIEDTAGYERAVRRAIAAAAPDPAGVAAVGHRFVHGGSRFQGAVLLSEEIAREIESFNHLAPLHNPPNLSGYRAARAALPGCPQVAVFDTAFHQTIPPRAHLYAIPYEYSLRHGIRRYGFHGSSHRYLTLRYAELHGGDPRAYKLITCHLGNGCSITAVDGGLAVDTSMGFTPLEGLVMGTRGGDLDAGALLHLMECEGLDTRQAAGMLNRASGLRGLSGLSHDMRELLAAEAAGDERARLALEVFCYRVTKYIGAYYAVLGGAAALIFTAGIGENAPEIRARICRPLGALGIRIDEEKNRSTSGREAEISPPGSATRVWVIPTDEELLIARETRAAVLSASPPEAR